ncbi:hypothetical protein F7725_022389, partial [Dissostichus mawsoni]
MSLHAAAGCSAVSLLREGGGGGGDLAPCPQMKLHVRQCDCSWLALMFSKTQLDVPVLKWKMFR